MVRRMKPRVQGAGSARCSMAPGLPGASLFSDHRYGDGPEKFCLVRSLLYSKLLGLRDVRTSKTRDQATVILLYPLVDGRGRCCGVVLPMWLLWWMWHIPPNPNY